MNEPSHTVPSNPDSPDNPSSSSLRRTKHQNYKSRHSFPWLARRRPQANADPCSSTGTTHGTSEHQLDALTQRIASLEAELESRLEAWIEAQEGREQVEQSLRTADAALASERALVTQLRAAIDSKKVQGRDEHLMRHIRNLVADRLTPEGCLYFVQTVCGDRVVVLESAFASARDASDFRHPERLLKLLGTFATDYHQALAAGKGDCEASICLGNSFAGKESDTTRGNSRAIRERTFEYNGRPVVMWPHLRIGMSNSVSDTIRVHFEWVAVEKKLVIGWCGEHRYLVR